MTLDEWQAQGRTFHYRDHPIFYRDAGTAGQGGVPLLLIHGFPTASWDWYRIWDDLVTRHRVIAPDMIGFGFSAKPVDYDYRIMDQADLHEALLDQLGISRFHLLAHDYGDTVAQELMARIPERIASVALLNGGLFPETHRARLIQKLLHSPLGPLISRLMNERKFAKSFAAVFGPDTQPSADELADFWRLVNHNGGNRIFHKLIRYIEDRRTHRERWVQAVVQPAMPMRVINGSLDPVSGEHMVQRLLELAPHSDVLRLPRIGHYPQVEAPTEVVQGYLDFLALHT